LLEVLMANVEGRAAPAASSVELKAIVANAPLALLALDRDGRITFLRMAQALGLETVAEGVERPEQASQLRALGSHYAQGYLFARPLLTADIDTFLARQALTPTASPHATPQQGATNPAAGRRQNIHPLPQAGRSPASWTATPSATSHTIATLRHPPTRTSAAIWSSSASERAKTATSAPRSASARAVARPIPRPAPVTSATRPARADIRSPPACLQAHHQVVYRQQKRDSSVTIPTADYQAMLRHAEANRVTAGLRNTLLPIKVDAEYAHCWRFVILSREVFAQFRLMILTAGVGLEGFGDPSQ
jgi:hypothetical protein